jgi:hypothetical protein
MNEVVCSKCSAIRPPELAATSERPPCPLCGGATLTFNLSSEVSASASAHCSSELIPGNQARDWKQRWKVLQEDLQFISSPRTEVMSGDSIHFSLQRLGSFFVQAYHLKDHGKRSVCNMRTSYHKMAFLHSLGQYRSSNRLLHSRHSRERSVILNVGRREFMGLTELDA